MLRYYFYRKQVNFPLTKELPRKRTLFFYQYINYERRYNMSVLKRILGGLVALIVLMSGISYGLADAISPLADDVFDATKVELSSSGRVKLYCVTYGNKASIKVTACWLEKKVAGQRAFDCSLTPPAEESNNTNGYAASFNCLSSIGEGTYRVAATFNADGYEITRYSVGVSF